MPQSITRSATAQGDGTTDYFLSGKGWPYFSLSFDTTGGGAGANTLTIFASNQDDGTAPADIPAANWVDVTNAWTGSASYAADGFVQTTVPRIFRWLRVRVVRLADGGANDGAWTIITRQNASLP